MSLFTRLAWLSLYLGAAFAFLVETGALGRPVAPDLTRLPERLGSLGIREEIPVDPAALGEQPPERSTFRRAFGADGEEGRLFVSYYRRAQRWSGRPHDVEKCYAAQGWHEREARRLAEAHRPWSRLFEREVEDENGPRTERIRVVHWIERPGPDQDRLSWRELAERVLSGRGFRPDVAAAYLEFPADAAPSDAECVETVRALSEALETLWTP